eukprot:TRINITY_DN31646_c0_g1_i1.p1 TRINITY_DN31646_c0_g1~~TRINITY_DN31646_c0_g1_i1.p1  ORF type:complete len:280 (+),score=85.05 TRINITY_DN31646_c0_g1_i1:388-1227(+)
MSSKPKSSSKVNAKISQLQEWRANQRRELQENLEKNAEIVKNANAKEDNKQGEEIDEAAIYEQYMANLLDLQKGLFTNMEKVYGGQAKGSFLDGDQGSNLDDYMLNLDHYDFFKAKTVAESVEKFRNDDGNTFITRDGAVKVPVSEIERYEADVRKMTEELENILKVKKGESTPNAVVLRAQSEKNSLPDKVKPAKKIELGKGKDKLKTSVGPSSTETMSKASENENNVNNSISNLKLAAAEVNVNYSKIKEDMDDIDKELEELEAMFDSRKKQSENEV